MANSFELDDWPEPAPIVCLSEGLTKDQVMEFSAFNDWQKTLRSSLSLQRFSDHKFNTAPYHLRKIDIQAFDRFDGRILFMKLFATVTNDQDEWLPGVVFLRGGSIAILIILRPSDSSEERWVIMTEQARVPACSLNFMGIPTGMLDKEGNFAGVAAREMKEDAGLQFHQNELIDMTSIAMQKIGVVENLPDAVYTSPGVSDEFISIFLCEKEMDRVELETLKDRIADVEPQMLKVCFRLLEYERLLEFGARDVKTLAAWSLYEYLKRAGEIP